MSNIYSITTRCCFCFLDESGKFFKVSTGIKLYLNPASHSLHVLLDRIEYQEAQLQIVDIYDQVQMAQIVSPNARNTSKQIDVSELINGVYYIVVKQNEISYSEKSIKIE